VACGVVSRGAALAHYGVAIGDERATAARRATMRKERKDAARALGQALVGAVRCRCGQPPRALSGRDTSYEAEAYTEGQQVRTASYLISETFCPACWAVVATRISVPEVEA